MPEPTEQKFCVQFAPGEKIRPVGHNGHSGFYVVTVRDRGRYVDVVSSTDATLAGQYDKAKVRLERV